MTNAAPAEKSHWCFSAEPAWREILAHNPDANPEAFVVLQAELKSKELLELTDSAARAAFNVTRAELVAPRYDKTQQVGSAIRARGFAAVLTYSYADQPDGRCLVVLEECLKQSKSKLAIQAIVPLLQRLPGLKE